MVLLEAVIVQVFVRVSLLALVQLSIYSEFSSVSDSRLKSNLSAHVFLSGDILLQPLSSK